MPGVDPWRTLVLKSFFWFFFAFFLLFFLLIRKKLEDIWLLKTRKTYDFFCCLPEAVEQKLVEKTSLQHFYWWRGSSSVVATFLVFSVYTFCWPVKFLETVLCVRICFSFFIKVLTKYGFQRNCKWLCSFPFKLESYKMLL